MEFTIIKSMAMTLSRSPQYRTFTRVVMDEKSLSPLFRVGGGCGGGGAVVTHDWYIIVVNDIVNIRNNSSEIPLLTEF